MKSKQYMIQLLDGNGDAFEEVLVEHLTQSDGLMVDFIRKCRPAGAEHIRIIVQEAEHTTLQLGEKEYYATFVSTDRKNYRILYED